MPKRKKDDQQTKKSGEKYIVKAPIDTTVETVNRTIETVKPYAEQAKKGLEVFGGFVRNAASEGAKRLIKILEESNDKKDE